MPERPCKASLLQCSACPAGAPPSVRNARLGFHGGAKCCARDYQGEDSGHPFCFTRIAGTPGCCEGATAAPTIFFLHKRANAAAMLKRCFTRSVLREGPRKAGGNSGTGAHQEPPALIKLLHVAQGAQTSSHGSRPLRAEPWRGLSTHVLICPSDLADGRPLSNKVRAPTEVQRVERVPA